MTTEEAERQLKEAREHLYEVLDEMESNNSSYDSYSTTTYGTDSTDTEDGSTSERRLDEALDTLDNLSNTVVQEVTGTPLVVAPFAIAFGGTILWITVIMAIIVQAYLSVVFALISSVVILAIIAFMKNFKITKRSHIKGEIELL